MQLVKNGDRSGAELLHFCADHGYTLDGFAVMFGNCPRYAVKEGEEEIPTFVLDAFSSRTCTAHHGEAATTRRARRALIQALLSLAGGICGAVAIRYGEAAHVAVFGLVGFCVCLASAVMSLKELNRIALVEAAVREAREKYGARK